MITKQDIIEKLESMTPDQIHESICKALESAGVPYTVGGGKIEFEPLNPNDYSEETEAVSFSSTMRMQERSTSARYHSAAVKSYATFNLNYLRTEKENWQVSSDYGPAA